MADDNLVLTLLREMRTEQASFKHAITAVTERLDRIELRLSTIEQTLGGLYALSASDRDTIQSLSQRIDRIERRLELID